MAMAHALPDILENKYTEEVEKCSTPGSVAEKKAYFEAHYRRISAQTIALLAQEQHAEVISPLRFAKRNCHNLNDDCEGSESTNAELDHLSIDKLNAVHLPKQNHFDRETGEEMGIQPKIAELKMDDMCIKLKNMEVEADVLVEEDHLTESQALVEVHQQFHKDENKHPVPKSNDLRLRRNLANKPSTKKDVTSKESNVNVTTKSVLSSTPKLITNSFPKTSKVAPSKILIRKSSSSLRLDGKRITTSLPNSQGLGSVSIKSAPVSFGRRDLIMDKMRDKEIVQRAFKAFRNNVYLSIASTDENPSITQKLSIKGENQNTTLDEKTILQREQASKRGWPSSMTRPSKDDRGSANKAKAAPFSVGIQSDRNTEKQREFFAKSLEKCTSKKMPKKHLRTKPKENKLSERDKFLKTLNTKITLVPKNCRQNGISGNHGIKLSYSSYT